jgi:hypothetical protein
VSDDKDHNVNRSWSEILEATGPLVQFLESVSDQVGAKWKGSVPPSIYGITADGREVGAAIQREGRRDAPEVPHLLGDAPSWSARARVAVVEAWTVTYSDGLPDVRPREHPARKEAVILEAMCVGGKLHGMRGIIRKDGKATLGPLWIAERDARPIGKLQ